MDGVDLSGLGSDPQRLWRDADEFGGFACESALKSGALTQSWCR